MQEQECKCELDGFQGAVWTGDCPLHGNKPMTNEPYFEHSIEEKDGVRWNNLELINEPKTMRERFDEKFNGYWRGESIPDEIMFFIEQELKKERDEIVEIIEQINPEHGAWKDSLDGFKAVIINTIKNRT